MTGNKAYLVDYQEFKGSSVVFGGSKGKITGKGKIRTRKLDINDVYFVKELQDFNLFSMSQMCDRKNKNIVPTGGLACLIAKATVDESTKWHRRLGHEEKIGDHQWKLWALLCPSTIFEPRSFQNPENLDKNHKQPTRDEKEQASSLLTLLAQKTSRLKTA
ncbi:hypothetical protein Tco_0192209 [Tanacetum coccineum]